MSNVIDIEKAKRERTQRAAQEVRELLDQLFMGGQQARLDELSKGLTKKQRGESDE